mmetsp:Transcript_2044/g.6729  ORF Transcript_2044/g.6729 Transcript_2044/m.6729 type:complete len:253 (-) Transcript_2044:466-1224(-)
MLKAVRRPTTPSAPPVHSYPFSATKPHAPISAAAARTAVSATSRTSACTSGRSSSPSSTSSTETRTHLVSRSACRARKRIVRLSCPSTARARDTQKVVITRAWSCDWREMKISTAVTASIRRIQNRYVGATLHHQPRTARRSRYGTMSLITAMRTVDTRAVPPSGGWSRNLSRTAAHTARTRRGNGDTRARPRKAGLRSRRMPSLTASSSRPGRVSTETVACSTSLVMLSLVSASSASTTMQTRPFPSSASC